MKKKLLTSFACVAMVLLGAVGLVGCGAKAELVTFKGISGEYDGKAYSVAATTWEKQANQDGFDGVWKLNVNAPVAYDAATHDALGFAADEYNFVGIQFVPAAGVEVKDATYFVNQNKITPFAEEEGETGLKLMMALKTTKAEDKDGKLIVTEAGNFTVTINWNADTTVKYSFIVAGAELAKAPAVEA